MPLVRSACGLTLSTAPLTVATRPRAATQVSRWRGASMTPITGSSSTATAMETHQSASPERKGVVPSIGSITHK
jgi:hypothetical protein